MAKLKNISTDENYPIDLEIGPFVIGKSERCDMRLKADLFKPVSREHAFIIEYEGEPYVGSISTEPTYLLKKKIFGWEQPVAVKNALKSRTFTDTYLNRIREDPDFRRDVLGEMVEDVNQGRYADHVIPQREFFLSEFVKNEDNLDALVDEDPYTLLHLDHGNIVLVAGYQLDFSEDFLGMLKGLVSKRLYFAPRVLKKKL